LKYGEVNGRLGPSRQHPVLWQYQRKGMPLIVVAEMDIWRKVRDINGDESWMRKSSITSVNKVVALSEIKLRRRAKDTAAITAIADKDALLDLIECNDSGWCKVRASEGSKGWVKRAYLWGSGPL
ncbi:MAG: hypothetical protein HKN36_08065, partial [Hellea sp.]|nr:hypothetical protein [Hellea sp.]